MKKYLQKKLNNEKGMTLIELLAVIVIIAIIAAIAIPAIGGIIENSRVGASKSDALSVLAAADLYLLDNGGAVDGAGTITGKELVDGNYIKDVGTFSAELAGVVITKETTSGKGLELSGSSRAGDIIITFANATKSKISSTPNSTRTTPTTITIAK
ncbi:prepilin-type N-terminal cleavage/methylation domain-containing protein [Planococcus sp. S3-L1]|uniref:prepilin-type N-terminal cleavage/methylation domain-containing protein n=1 Tax=Planococcus sp. S3-L1 TaxID=3046200 RepID=UPI0024BB08B0|nr:prepilin-type N-terminal cleavage/methylation domain-containing protein [Planococcus sp. S3-L1]MDJ0330994.1 prepilin-type N-terminal cleavage/methylation domain-containing protein [Planococcus sp. S3-L1]